MTLEEYLRDANGECTKATAFPALYIRTLKLNITGLAYIEPSEGVLVETYYKTRHSGVKIKQKASALVIQQTMDSGAIYIRIPPSSFDFIHYHLGSQANVTANAPSLKTLIETADETFASPIANINIGKHTLAELNGFSAITLTETNPRNANNILCAIKGGASCTVSGGFNQTIYMTMDSASCSHTGPVASAKLYRVDPFDSSSVQFNWFQPDKVEHRKICAAVWPVIVKNLKHVFTREPPQKHRLLTHSPAPRQGS